MKRTDAEGGLLRFSGGLTIGRAAEFKRRMLTVIQAGGSIDLLLEGATEADLSFFQLVCALHKAADKQGRDVRILSPVPPGLRQVICCTGFDLSVTCRKDGCRKCLWDAEGVHER